MEAGHVEQRRQCLAQGRAEPPMLEHQRRQLVATGDELLQDLLVGRQPQAALAPAANIFQTKLRVAINRKPQLMVENFANVRGRAE